MVFFACLVCVILAFSVFTNTKVIAVNSNVVPAHQCGSPKIGPVLRGVDFVAFYNQYKLNQSFPTLPLMGVSSYQSIYGSYRFWFQSAANLKAFEASPDTYLPEFGGYCAWGLTGYDIHVSDPSGFALGGACVNSTNGFSFVKSQGRLENIWYLLEEAKYDMEQTETSLEDNLERSRANFALILAENNVSYCFNTNSVHTCE